MFSIKNFKIFSLLFGLITVLSGCFETAPIDNLKTDDTRIYFINYDKKINFKDYKTYFIPDSIFVIKNNETRISNNNNTSFIIDNFKLNIGSKKYTFVKKAQNPDIGITIARVSDSDLGLDSPIYFYFNNYWNFPRFNPKGTAYPGYYKNYEVNDYMWNVEFVDLKNAKKNGELAIICNMQIRGEGIFEDENLYFIFSKAFEIATFL
jgi:hypothetical protein